MWRSFFKDKKWFYWSYGGGTFILLLLVTQTYLDVLFNSWYKEFYDILQTAEKREISEFWESIKKFLYIALPYVTIFAFATLYQRAGILYGQEISFSPVDALYFSVVTWTTLGYGDFQPTESLRLLAAFQALLGTFFIPMLIAAVLFSLQLKSQKHSLQKNTNGSKP